MIRYVFMMDEHKNEQRRADRSSEVYIPLDRKFRADEMSDSIIG